ncbi:MAG: hypothetical protein JJU11_12150 [Candidatus Sumerlaeia bacterium]|nr:hypothetical protein [Candidatus Sumerlaeia bacterium]
MDWTPREHFTPLPSPRRDGYLGRARILAAGFLTTVSAIWTIAFMQGLGGEDVDLFPILLLFIVGLLVLFTKISLVAELALAWVDLRHELESAPNGREITMRFLTGIAGPFAILALGFLGRDSTAIILVCIGAVLIAEFFFKFGPYGRWWKGEIYLPTLKALLRGRISVAADELAHADDLSGANMEASYLAVAGMAIRIKEPKILKQLLEQLATVHPTDPKERLTHERLMAVLCADRARLEDPDNAGVREAEALRLIPIGHPRRLPLALFVATEALDNDDGESAIKALSLLHSRDIPTAVGRILVNWLLLQAAVQVGQKELEAACHNALRTFKVRRLAGALSINADSVGGDSYDRWLKKAKSSLEKYTPPESA